MCVFVVWRLGCVSLSLSLSISLFLAPPLFLFSVPHYTCRAISSLTVKHQGLFKRSSLIRNCLEELLFSFQAAKITVIKLKISTVFIYLLLLIGRRNMGLITIFPHFLSFRCRRFDQSAPGCGIKRLKWFIGFCSVHWGMSSFSCHATLKISVAYLLCLTFSVNR